MRSVLGLFVLISLAAAHANAAPRKVLVLPLDGDVDPETRTKLNLTVQKTARAIPDTSITVGDTTFEETAAAIGCEPAQPTCPEMVRTTLGVDELVYGTATPAGDGKTTVTVKRVRARTAPREQTTTIAPSDPPERGESELRPFFDGKPATAPSSGPVVTDPVPPPPVPPTDNSRRNKGILLLAGGGLGLIVGLALWTTVPGLEDQIAFAPINDADDFAALEELENRAFRNALVGDILVVAGVVVGTYGAYVIYKDRKERRVVVTPAVTASAAGVAVGGRW